ncbi:L,D-transpeptidase family protein [Novosphingobium bradum]|uniref:L,D-transpeptidase family protein n=1 Tax=Novosphingobium bradum TaxID=1737444 RepID=A0ABV7INQ2_9SPHN
MKRFLPAFAALLAVPLSAQAPVPAAPSSPAPRWSAPVLASLHKWLAAAPEDALPPPDASALEAAERLGDTAAVDNTADALALKLARMHLAGCCDAAAHAGWHITDTDRTDDLPARIAAAVAGGTLDAFFAGLAPDNPEYAALRAALATEKDPARKATLARNMERWRWLPRDPGAGSGGRYLLVNTAAFEVSTWAGVKRLDRRAVINGKVSSPTPIFSARVTGIIFNPWWDLPPNIVREGIGALAARNPAAARAKGYVWSGGHFRQRPGPTNSLGAMKLVMPNPYNIYLHDTPAKQLFARPVRAFSHGCVRVSDALGFAATLVDESRPAVDARVAAGATVTVPLPAPLPVYIAYFTAGLGPDGQVAFYPDIYRRDGAMGDKKDRRKFCPA